MVKQLEFLTNAEDQLVYVGTVENGNETPLDITYDPKYVGNPLSIGTKQLTWEGRRLKQIIDGTNTFTYTYNEQGLRTKKNIKGVETKYYLQGSNIVAEKKNDRIIHYIYNEQNQLVGFEHQQNNYFYVRDLLGIIRNIIDVNGNIVVTYKYDGWGNHKVYGSSNVENTSTDFIGNINPFRYKGYYYDVETDWYYLQNRYYSPLLSRFINMDHTLYLEPGSIDGINLFAYCANNPVMYADPSGCVPEWLGWALTGVALVGLTALTVLSLGTAAPITGVMAGVIIGATCGAYAGAITSVVSQGIFNGWDNISSWAVLKQTGIGAFTGAISGLGAGLGTTVLTGGISQVTSGLFDGSIDSFSDGLIQFALGGMLAGMTYGLGKTVSNKLAVSKISKIIGNSNKNAVINKRLVAAGFNNLKVGVKGMGGVVNHLYKYYGYQALNSLISGIADGTISLIGGIF